MAIGAILLTTLKYRDVWDIITFSIVVDRDNEDMVFIVTKDLIENDMFARGRYDLPDLFVKFPIHGFKNFNRELLMQFFEVAPTIPKRDWPMHPLNQPKTNQFLDIFNIVRDEIGFSIEEIKELYN